MQGFSHLRRPDQVFGAEAADKFLHDPAHLVAADGPDLFGITGHQVLAIGMTQDQQGNHGLRVGSPRIVLIDQFILAGLQPGRGNTL